MGELTIQAVERCLAQPKLRALVNELIRAGRLAGRATAEELFRLLREAEHLESFEADAGLTWRRGEHFDETADVIFEREEARNAYLKSYRQEPVVKASERARKRRDRADPDKRERANQRRRESRADPTSRDAQGDRRRAEARRQRAMEARQAKLSECKKKWQEEVSADREERKAKLRERLMPLAKVRCAPPVDELFNVRDSRRQSGRGPLVG